MNKFNVSYCIILFNRRISLPQQEDIVTYVASKLFWHSCQSVENVAQCKTLRSYLEEFRMNNRFRWVILIPILSRELLTMEDRGGSRREGKRGGGEMRRMEDR
jgi:hypothetical protein